MKFLNHSRLSLVFAFGLTTKVLSASSSLLTCQVQKPPGVPPLLGCPKSTLYVSKNVDEPLVKPGSAFQTVGDALASLSDAESAVIVIAAGVYEETINITRSGPLTLLGQLPTSSIKSPRAPFADPTKVPFNTNLVKIVGRAYVQPGSGMDNAQTAVLIVAPNFNASLIGAGPTGAPLQPEFGTKDLKVYNIDFENAAANYAISQALVTDISYAKASFYGCSFASYQDTWYTGRNASTYVIDSIIYGQTDYLFGFGTAWFEKIILANRACGGGIVAWKGTNQTDAPRNRYGAYISNSVIMRSPDANETTITKGKCYLGRPWNDLATTVYLNTYMDNSIQPAGWTPFNSARPTIAGTTFYAEYDSTGPGGNDSNRIAADHILTSDEAKEYALEQVFGGRPKWIDFSYERKKFMRRAREGQGV